LVFSEGLGQSFGEALAFNSFTREHIGVDFFDAL